eukprot:4306575-Prymnesium_polylepis.1
MRRPPDGAHPTAPRRPCESRPIEVGGAPPRAARQLGNDANGATCGMRIDWLVLHLSLIHISEPTRRS